MAQLVYAETFSSGNPTYARFENGRFCTVCGCLTEHKKENGFIICDGCGTKRPYLKKANPDYKATILRGLKTHHAYYDELKRYILSSELAVVIQVCPRQKSLRKFNFDRHWRRFHAIIFDGNRRLSELENLYQMENSADKNIRLSNQKIIEKLLDMEGD